MNQPLRLALAFTTTVLFACSSSTPGPATDPDGGGGGGGGDAAQPGIDAAHPGTPDAGGNDAELAAACAPKIDYVNTSADGNGALFDQHVSDVNAYFAARSLEVCRVLYHQASEVPPRPTLKFVVEDSDGVAYTACGGDTCDEMHFSSTYMRDYADGGGDIGAEIDGVVVHELTHVYQLWDAPGWLIEGQADFVRYRAGYIPISNRQQGGHYDDAYQTTAFFLDYVDLSYPPDFGWKLNQAMDHHDNVDWSDDVFIDLTGKSVSALWDEYQASF